MASGRAVRAASGAGRRSAGIRTGPDGAVSADHLKVGTLYSPPKLFFPISTAFFTGGVGYYLFTVLTTGRFTNMGA
jgi:hypothetical protein